ncbi:hypothetical protein [Nocardioides soli]|uniref:Uncharacterized protein n=1 Tax=Nocardioides soli TaxID=1036020 RepID=A0A7W4Z552_9ACTN|nr:hypothetical protein [Nocardioides soli]MBB3045571.1 hypothetical protein [Nocardioides soli]
MRTEEPSTDADAAPFEWRGLFVSAQRFAQACVDNYSVRDAPFFFLHAGASVELAVKAALCKASPVLLLEGGNRFKDVSLLRLAGLRPTRQRDEQVFTVGFESAIRRLQLLYGDGVLGVGPDGLAALKAARDVTAHGGQVSESTGDALFRVLVTLGTIQNALAQRLDSTPEEFWGAAWPTVEKALRQRQDDIKQQLAVSYAAARKRFAERTRDLDEEAIDRLLEQAGDRVNPSKNVMPRQCPVCSGKGLSVERPEQRVANRRSGTTVIHGWMATNFTCPVCHLTLESEALVNAAPDFEAWESADEHDLLEIWQEDMAALDSHDTEDFT